MLYVCMYVCMCVCVCVCVYIYYTCMNVYIHRLAACQTLPARCCAKRRH